MTEESADQSNTFGRSTVIVHAVAGLLFALVLPLLIVRPRTIASIFLGWTLAVAVLLCICSAMGLLFAALSFRTTAKQKLPRPWYLPSLVLTIMSVFWLGLVLDKYVLNTFRERAELRNKTETFDGSSKDLEHTAIVLTLDTPLPANKNVIWCSSFQIAWNEMKDSVVKGPMQVAGAEEIAERLNNAKASKNDVEGHDYFAAADWVGNDIVKHIQEGMKEKFPDEPVPEFDPMPPDWAVAFAYLQAMIEFTHPFDKMERFHFTDSNGNETAVVGFGCEDCEKSCEKARQQVEVLYCGSEKEPDGYIWHQKGFAVDLCKHSQPYQIVLACVEPRDTLDDMLNDLEQNIAEYRSPDREDEDAWYSDYRPSVDFVEPLMIPEMFWKISHHFEELERKTLRGMGPIVEASQVVHFRLDRFGAILKSESRLIVGGAGRSFIFNKPFLLYVKKRGSANPFLVMWVDNAELLTPRSTGK